MLFFFLFLPGNSLPDGNSHQAVPGLFPGPSRCARYCRRSRCPLLALFDVALKRSHFVLGLHADPDIVVVVVVLCLFDVVLQTI